MGKCKCTLAQSAVGDGCDVCNPALALEHAEQAIADLKEVNEQLRDWLYRIYKQTGWDDLGKFLKEANDG